MKTSSAKAKGRKLQQHVVSVLLNKYPTLTERDVRSTPMGVSSDDITLSEAASKVFPYSVECKNQEHISIWAALDQSQKENRGLAPLLVFKRNRSDTYCCIKLDDFMRLL